MLSILQCIFSLYAPKGCLFWHYPQMIILFHELLQGDLIARCASMNIFSRSLFHGAVNTNKTQQSISLVLLHLNISVVRSEDSFPGKHYPCCNMEAFLHIYLPLAFMATQFPHTPYVLSVIVVGNNVFHIVHAPQRTNTELSSHVRRVYMPSIITQHQISFSRIALGASLLLLFYVAESDPLCQSLITSPRLAFLTATQAVLDSSALPPHRCCSTATSQDSRVVRTGNLLFPSKLREYFLNQKMAHNLHPSHLTGKSQGKSLLNCTIPLCRSWY